MLFQVICGTKLRKKIEKLQIFNFFRNFDDENFNDY